MQGWPELKLGTNLAEVGNWQRFLIEQACFDGQGRAILDDESFGPRTLQATHAWQTRNAIPLNVIVGPKARLLAQEQGFIPFVQAKNFGPLLHPNRTRLIDVIVIHTMESAEKPDTAESVGLWFAGKTQYEAPKASAHYGIDSDGFVQYVRDWDVAWHAPGCNHNGIGLEHAGRAAQTGTDWSDEASLKILDYSATLAARIVKRYGLPVVRLSPLELAKGGRGFCGHDDATIAFPGPGRTHWDPGKGFPWDAYLDRVRILTR